MAEGLKFADGEGVKANVSVTVKGGQMQSGGPVECPCDGAALPNRTASVSFGEKDAPSGGPIKSPVDD